ncbi:unnamed protein product [Caenorhabditis brenneri]
MLPIPLLSFDSSFHFRTLVKAVSMEPIQSFQHVRIPTVSSIVASEQEVHRDVYPPYTVEVDTTSFFFRIKKRIVNAIAGFVCGFSARTRPIDIEMTEIPKDISPV